jgi:peptide-methionine (S)-S-oxide reductase
MNPAVPSLDTQFREAVSAIDAGDIPALERLLDAHPGLADERLDAAGAWLRDQVGRALDGFFARPYLLWFVAEDPVRTGTLPANIADVTRTLIATARRAGVTSLPEQLDYTLSLVAWSGVAARCGVQLELLDVLLEAGARPDGNSDNALVNGHEKAAAHLVARGAPLTLGTALCLGRWDAVTRLAAGANAAQRQFAFVLAALNGRAEGLRRALALGVALNAPSADLHSHATALHHAVGSGELEAVRVLVEAGADREARDTLWDGTPLGWAEHYVAEGKDAGDRRRYAAIAAYLRSLDVGDPT